MGIIRVVLFSIMGVAGATLPIILAAELYAWAPRLTDRLIRRAVRKLPNDQQARYDEEWRSHINEIPGHVGKLFSALSLQWASWLMSGRTTLVNLRQKFANSHIRDAFRLKRIAIFAIGSFLFYSAAFFIDLKFREIHFIGLFILGLFIYFPIWSIFMYFLVDKSLDKKIFYLLREKLTKAR